MPKMAATGEDHRQAVRVARGDDMHVSWCADWMNDRGGLVEGIVEWEKRIGGKCSAAGAGGRFLDGDFHRIHAAHLPCADPNHRLRLRKHDRIRLHVATYGPSETQVAELGVGRFG